MTRAVALRSAVEDAARRLRALPGWPACDADPGLVALADAALTPGERWLQAQILWDHHQRARVAPSVLAAMPDPNAPDTLGWRMWIWDAAVQRLRSPMRKSAIWHTPELRVDHWDTREVLRGVAGIHARRVPIDWRRAIWIEDRRTEPRWQDNAVAGIVERYGRYVLGTRGWRAEWVVIRKLLAPNNEIGLALERAYPDVEVIYEDR